MTGVQTCALPISHIDCLSKIELVDGSDVLESLSGEELQAINYYDSQHQGQEELSLTATDVNTSVVSLDFGRYLYDTDLALDPRKFRNLQLKVTWDEDASNTSVVSNSLEIYADVFDKKTATPRGFLMNKEIYSYTPASSAFEYIDLPTDYTIRKLLIRSKSTTLDPYSALSQVKISEDNDKVVPFSLTGEQLFRLNKDAFPRMSEKMTLDGAITAKTIYLAPTVLDGFHINYDATDFVTAQTHFPVATITNNKVALSASVDIKALTAEYSGYAPNSVLCVPFGLQNDESDWYDVKGIGSLQLQNKGSASVGSNPEAQIILQQLRTY